MVHDEEPTPRDVYRKVYKLPDPSDRDQHRTSEKRYTTRNSNYRIDLRPRMFAKMMKIEIIILFFGVAFAVSKITII
jgi:hypothetical protein